MLACARGIEAILATALILVRAFIGLGFMVATILAGRAYLRRRTYRVRSVPYFASGTSWSLKLLNPVRSTDLRAKLVLSVICLLFLFWPLIDVRYYFLDDVARSVEGYYRYTSSGRPLIDALLGALTWGEYLSDISPAPQLLGVFCLALAAVLLADRLQVDSPLSMGILALAVGGSPYFLENMSFRFDSGFMALGVLCAIVPFWLERGGRPAPFAASAALLLASLCLYQPTINCYPVVGLCLMAHALACRPVRDVLAMGLRFALPLVVAVMAYQSLWRMLPGLAGNLADRGELAPLHSAFSTAVGNLGTYGGIVLRDWGSTKLGLVWGLMAVAMGVVVAGRIVASSGRSPVAKAAACAVAMGLLIAAFPAAFLSQTLLVKPVFASRAFVGVTALIAVASATLLSVRHGTMGLLARGLVLLQVLGLVGVTYTYANALRMQEQHDDRITSAIVNDIFELEPSGKVWSYAISGWTGRSPPVEIALANYPALTRSVFSLVYQESYWAPYRFKAFGLWVKPAPAGQVDRLALICNGTPLKRNARYDLYLVEQTVLIRFKNDGVKCA